MKRKELILNPYFITGLFILLLNDFYLKYQYGNFITGKLSDFAGLLIFPMFVASVFPKAGKNISLITGIGFIIWKLPLFTPVIDLINQIPFVTIGRVIDYTDYMALQILPLSHYLINHHENRLTIGRERIKSVSKYALLGIAFFAFCATSMIPPWEIPKGTIFIDKSYNIKLPKDSVISSIRELGYNCDLHEKDTMWIDDVENEQGLRYRRTIGYYQTDNIVRYYDDSYGDSIVLDTIANVKYRLTEVNPNKTRLTIINVTLSKEGNIQSWKTLKSLSKTYSSWLKDNLIEKID